MWHKEASRSTFGGEEVAKGSMTYRHVAPFVGSGNMKNSLEVQQDVNDFESFYTKKERYPNNRAWIMKESDGGDDDMEMGEML